MDYEKSYTCRDKYSPAKSSSSASRADESDSTSPQAGDYAHYTSGLEDHLEWDPPEWFKILDFYISTAKAKDRNHEYYEPPSEN